MKNLRNIFSKLICVISTEVKKKRNKYLMYLKNKKKIIPIYSH